MPARIHVDPEWASPVIRSLPPEIKKRFKAVVRAVADDPTGAEGQVDLLELDVDRMSRRVFRARFGDWRMVYALDGTNLYVLKVFHRREGYGWLARLGGEFSSNDV